MLFSARRAINFSPVIVQFFISVEALKHLTADSVSPLSKHIMPIFL